MTPRQRKLARHALGLPNRRRVSYRNHYAAVHASEELDEWAKMEAAGAAVVGTPRGNIARCYLTIKGAKAALDLGESLDPEDFPDA